MHSQICGIPVEGSRTYGDVAMKRELARRTQREIVRVAHDGLDWVTFATAVNDALARVVPLDRACWHPVVPARSCSREA